MTKIAQRGKLLINNIYVLGCNTTLHRYHNWSIRFIHSLLATGFKELFASYLEFCGMIPSGWVNNQGGRYCSLVGLVPVGRSELLLHPSGRLLPLPRPVDKPALLLLHLAYLSQGLLHHLVPYSGRVSTSPKFPCPFFYDSSPPNPALGKSFSFSSFPPLLKPTSSSACCVLTFLE